MRYHYLTWSYVSWLIDIGVLESHYMPMLKPRHGGYEFIQSEGLPPAGTQSYTYGVVFEGAGYELQPDCLSYDLIYEPA